MNSKLSFSKTLYKIDYNVIELRQSYNFFERELVKRELLTRN